MVGGSSVSVKTLEIGGAEARKKGRCKRGKETWFQAKVPERPLKCTTAPEPCFGFHRFQAEKTKYETTVLANSKQLKKVLDPPALESCRHELCRTRPEGRAAA